MSVKMTKRWLEILAIATGKSGTKLPPRSVEDRFAMIARIAKRAVDEIKNSPESVRERNAREADADGEHDVAMMIRAGR